MSYKSGQYTTYSLKNPQTRGFQVSRSLSGSETDVSSSAENLTQEDRFVICNTLRQEPQGQENNRNSSDSSYNTLIIHGASDDHRLSNGGGNNSYMFANKYTASGGSKDISCRRSFDPSMSEITNIPDDYLSQSQVLKHLAKEVKVPYNSNRQNEDSTKYSKHGGNRLSESNPLNRSFRSKSKSQPDLSHNRKINKTEPSVMRHTIVNTRKEQRCMQMVDHLILENNNLKLELEACYQKVAKSQKLEQEVGKVHKAHEDLVESCDRRERLERAARSKLQSEVRRLQDTNRSLREQVDIISKQLIAARVSYSGIIDTPELSKRDALIAQLVAQNKELMATKDRQDIELSAQRVTLEEQRTHIDILDTALTNAQSNVVRLEEECRKKQMHVDRVAQLQRALSSLQLASDRREQTERKLRLQLENELRIERSHNRSQYADGSGDSNEHLPDLKRKLREKDEKIMHLEGEVAKWEQRYLEESELRQAAIDAASIPKDAKIAALEKTSQESEKIIAEARSDKLRQMDEVHAAQKKVTDLESRMKELESKLAEKDAMIRVLQKKHSYEKDAATCNSSYQSISLGHHTPHSSLNTTDLSAEDLASSVLTSSTGFGSSTSYNGSVNSSFHQRGNKYNSSIQSFDQKSLDDQLKELDSQLLSKSGLCCFPGFSHPGAVSRKGKASQPLLASVTGSSLPLFEPGSLLQGLIGPSSNNRPDDMMLLEKQGLSSQAQRQDLSRGGSLPPSSLPRPKRHRKSSATTKLGEYGRLSDSEITITRKSSTDSSADNTCSKSSRDSPVLTEKKLLGEYTRLSDVERKIPTSSSAPPSPTTEKIKESSGIPMSSSLSRKYGEFVSCCKTSNNMDMSRSSPSRRFTQSPFEHYPNDERKMPSESPPPPPKIRDSPGRSTLLKWGEYNKLNIPGNERKVIMNSNTTVSSEGDHHRMKVRTSPIRSLIPAPRKVSDYSSCFATASQQDTKLGPNVESKLRIFSPGGVPGRRGSLQRESTKKDSSEGGGVRSLPTPNKYRIHF